MRRILKNHEARFIADLMNKIDDGPQATFTYSEVKGLIDIIFGLENRALNYRIKPLMDSIAALRQEGDKG